MTFSVCVAALQMTCSFVVHCACAKDCFTRSQNCYQKAVFKNISVVSEEAAVCISHGIAAKSWVAIWLIYEFHCIKYMTHSVLWCAPVDIMAL